MHHLKEQNVMAPVPADNDDNVVPSGVSAEEAARVSNKRYFSIGEVGEICQVKTHVLRYWEQEFPQLSPIKRRGNRRYYTRQDVFLIMQIKNLLYSEGFTIEGARTQLGQDHGKKHHQVQRSHQVISSAIAMLEETLQDLQYDEG